MAKQKKKAANKKPKPARAKKVITPTPQAFRATLERAGNLGWTVIYLPFDVNEVWGTRAQIRIRGEVNGFEFRSAAFPTKRGLHFVLINRKMQKGGKVVAGSTAKFRVEPDLEVRKVKEPEELREALKEDKRLEKWYRSELSDSARSYIAKWVGAAKQAATRTRRAEQMAERLLSTMEAERELPPVIRRLMDQTPGAYAGWQRMSPAARRRELLGIFYYCNPESQQKRIAKTIEVMLQKADGA
ncbi:MAG TPA: YdeI/OmpD-associated family protein [Terriglobales bacterium]|nr:YdeI/OmpD-associated family protein [Terriglobales bacterium]